MEILCAHTNVVNIDSLVPNPKNANRHPPEQIKLLAKIMKHQGWRNPIVVSTRSGFITKGHGRLEAARLNGWSEAPIDEQHYANEADEYADMIADNKIAELADTDLAMVLKDVLDLGPDFDFDLLGIPDFKLPEDFAPQCDEDEVPENVEPRTKPGDLYVLGNHRLLCGDSTNIQHVERLMGGEKADMVFTDPPYGISLVTDQRKTSGKMVSSDGEYRSNLKVNNFKPIANDDKDFDPGLILGVFGYCKEIFLWGANNYSNRLPRGGWICWDRKGSESGDRSLSSDFELCWLKEVHKFAMFRVVWHGLFGHSKRDDGDKKVHPSMKPVKLIVDIFERWCGGLVSVVDLYGGSGSTLIACEKTNRKCFMMELDPHYCDVIISRWERYSGKKAQLDG